MKDINNSILKQKNILVRVDLNVPFINGVITDYSRIEAIQNYYPKVKRKEK